MSIILSGPNRLNRFTNSLLFLGILTFGNLISHGLFAQASVVPGSASTVKTNYSPGAGNNRLLVVSVANETGNNVRSITSITWGGQALTFAVARNNGGSSSNDLRGEIWYLNEAGITAATGYCNNFTITWSGAISTEMFAVFTLKDVDQTTPVAATGSASPVANSTVVALPNMAAGVNDIACYAITTQANSGAHTPAAGYTEQSDIIFGTAAGIATAAKAITVAGNEAPSATWTTSNQLLGVGVVFNGVTAGQAGQPTTYYSRNATLGGSWNDNNSWTTSSDGSGGPLAAGVWPRRHDNVVVRSGHTITIDAVDDNKSCGISPDGLGRTNVSSVGNPFPNSNIPMFYHTGDISVSGTLTVNVISIILEGYTHLTSTGTFTLVNTLVNLGYMEADASATWNGFDKLVLAGNSTTIINTTSSTLTDDLIISYLDATLCGAGITTLQNGAGSTVDLRNGATVAQICTSFRVECSGSAGGGCGNSATVFPLTGSTVMLLGNTGPGGIGNSSNNRLWLRAHDITGITNGNPITVPWSDFSGNGLSASNATAAERPSFRTTPVAPTPSANGFPFVTFDGVADNLSLGAPAVLNFAPGTNSWSFFTVFSSPLAGPNAGTQNPNQGTLFSKAWNTGNRNYQYQIDDIDGTTSAMASYVGSGPLTGGTVVCNNNAWTVFSHTNNLTTRSSWTNEGVNMTTGLAFGAGSEPTTDVLIGARRDTGPTTGEGFWYAGSIAEIIMYNVQVNTAQRIIIDNYLAAKYATPTTTLTANNVYRRDDAGFDYEVAGIGQATDGSSWKDAQGTGIVRMWNPSALGNNEFLVWGHDNATLNSSTTTGVGAPIQEKLVRTWSVSELNVTGGLVDVGTVSVSFNISALSGSVIPSSIRLLIDRNANGFSDNDVAPVEGSYVNNTIVFSGVNFVDGDRFTLGNIDPTRSLPVELTKFSATPENHTVQIDWTTASETDNDFFTVERSKNAQQWETVKVVPGAGTSKVKTHYETVDDGPYTGTSYYRLKQTDFDKKVTHSGLVRVVLDYETPITLYPNPFSNNFRIVAEFEIDPKQVKLYNSNGIEMAIAVKKDGQQVIADPGSIPPGLYFLKVTDGFVTKTIKVIKKQSD
jgi:hypothetical protein